MRVFTSPSNERHVVPAGFPEIPERIDWAETACRDAGMPPTAPTAADLEAYDAAAAVGLGAHRRPGETSRRGGHPLAGQDRHAGVSGQPRHSRRGAGRGPHHALRARPGPHRAARAPRSRWCARRDTTPRRGRRWASATSTTSPSPPGTGSGAAGCASAILDFDVHHGNGTQDIFWEDGSVFFCSLHEDPRMQYPGSGLHPRARGRQGAGNHAEPAVRHRHDRGRRTCGRWRSRPLPALEAFRPELLLVSAGFDSHREDPLGGLLLTGADFARMGELIAGLAARTGGAGASRSRGRLRSGAASTTGCGRSSRPGARAGRSDSRSRLVRILEPHRAARSPGEG